MTGAPSESEKMVGALLGGRYRLVRLLGEGGMGAVFEARNPSGDASCAVKILLADYKDEPEVVSRFFDEGRASQRLSHPNIVRMYEAGRAEDGSPFIAMELLQGKSMADVIEARKAMPLDFVVAVGKGILEGLAHAHAAGVVHRDLKPENVFVDGEGAAAKPTILDFGLAKVMDAAGGMGKRTRTGMLLGTPGYMAPEQIGDARAADARSDLFSVGVILFEILTGKDPFPSANPFEKLTKMLTAEAPSVSSVSPEHARFDGFFRRALANQKEQRFQNAAEMRDALLAFASGAVVPPQRDVPTHMTQERPSWATGASPATPHIPVLSLPPSGPSSADVPKSGGKGLWIGVGVVVVVILGAVVAIFATR